MQEIDVFTLEPDAVRGRSKERTTIGALAAQGKVDLLDMPVRLGPGRAPVSRIEIRDAASGVRVVAFNRPEVRNAFDTAMYEEVTAALRAADADADGVGAVVLTGRGSCLHFGPGPGGDGRHRHRAPPSPGPGRGSWACSTCVERALGPPPRRGERRGRRPRLHPARPLRPRAGGRRGAPAGAVRRAGGAARGGQQRAVPRRHGLATSGPGAAHLGLGDARTSWWSSVWPSGCANPAPCSTRRWLSPRASPPTPAAPPGPSPPFCGRRGAMPCEAANRREQAAFATLLEHRGGRRGPGRIRGQGPGIPRALTVRLGITAALTDLDLTPASLAAAARSSASTRSGCPSTPTSRCGRTPRRRWSRACAATTTSAVSTPSSRCPPLPRSPPASGSVPASCWRPSTTPSCWPSRWPHSIISPVAASPSGVGFGWNRAEAEDHGVDFARRHDVVREHLAAMEAIWSADEAEYHGEFVDFDPTWSWPKPRQQPRVRTLIGGGATDTVLSAVVDGRRRLDPHRRQRPDRGRPAPARAGRDSGPRPGRTRGRAVRDHRRSGQARALRPPGDHRGGAARPGRRRGVGAGRAGVAGAPRPLRCHTGIDHDRPHRRHHTPAREHDAAPEDHQRRRPPRRAAAPVGHLAAGPLHGPRPQGRTPRHRRDGAHRRRLLPPDLRPRRAPGRLLGLRGPRLHQQAPRGRRRLRPRRHDDVAHHLRRDAPGLLRAGGPHRRQRGELGRGVACASRPSRASAARPSSRRRTGSWPRPASSPTTTSWSRSGAATAAAGCSRCA